jgi:FkbM family methyltransferase
MNIKTVLVKIVRYSTQAAVGHGLKGKLPCGWNFVSDWHRFFKRSPSLVFDVGANVGQTSLAWIRYWPNADFFAFEPVSKTFEQLKKNVRHTPSIRAHHLALGNVSGSLKTSLSDDSECNSLLSSDPSKPMEEVVVETLDEFWNEQCQGRMIDLLKLDV